MPGVGAVGVVLPRCDGALVAVGVRGRRCLTGDTVADVTTVTVRELRNNGGEVLDRVMRGDTVIVTRDGHEVAELRPLPSPAVEASVLLARWRHLPAVDPVAWRADIDSVLDASL